MGYEKGEKGGDKDQQKSSSTTSIDCASCGNAFMGVRPWSSLDITICTPCQLHEREKPDSSTAVQEGEAEGGEGPEKKRRRGTRRIKRNLPTSSVDNSDLDGSASAQAKKIARRNFREEEDLQRAIEESKITAL